MTLDWVSNIYIGYRRFRGSIYLGTWQVVLLFTRVSDVKLCAPWVEAEKEYDDEEEDQDENNLGGLHLVALKSYFIFMSSRN